MASVIADSRFIIALTNQLDQRHAEVRLVYLQYPQILLLIVAVTNISLRIGRFFTTMSCL